MWTSPRLETQGFHRMVTTLWHGSQMMKNVIFTLQIMRPRHTALMRPQLMCVCLHCSAILVCIVSFKGCLHITEEAHRRGEGGGGYLSVCLNTVCVISISLVRWQLFQNSTIHFSLKLVQSRRTRHYPVAWWSWQHFHSPPIVNVIEAFWFVILCESS